MSTVAPKLFFCEKKHCQIPVWEIITEKGKAIYYERLHHDGYYPIGTIGSIVIGDTNITCVDVVKSNRPIIILTVKDGYDAPLSWYEQIPGSSLNRNKSVRQFST